MWSPSGSDTSTDLRSVFAVYLMAADVIVSDVEISKISPWGNMPFLQVFFVLQCLISFCAVIASSTEEVRQLVWLKVWRRKEVISLVWSWIVRTWLFPIGGVAECFCTYISKWICKCVFTGLMEKVRMFSLLTAGHEKILAYPSNTTTGEPKHTANSISVIPFLHFHPTLPSNVEM